MKNSDKTTIFIERAKKVHGDKYDYSKVEYKDCDTPVTIICPIHGEFKQTPYKHLNLKRGCKCCAWEKNAAKKKSSKDDFIFKAKKVHGDKYDYSNVVYKNALTKILIKCNTCGNTFNQTPNKHLLGEGCPKCAGKNKTLKDFIKEANQIHGYKFDYSKSNYKNAKDKIEIICPKHGSFFQSPNKHLSGQGCPICKESHLEEIVRQLLSDNNIKFIYQYKTDWLGLQSLDFYLPDYKTAIECQGIQHFKLTYFGGEKKDGIFEKIQERDNVKSNKCKRNNVKLLYFSNLKMDFPYNVITNKNELLKRISFS